MVLSALRSRRAAILTALGIASFGVATAASDVEALSCKQKCKKKPKSKQKACKQKCNKDSTGTTCPSGDVNCDDFATHAEAQRFFEQCGGPANDRYGLDADHDGIACESLP